MADETRALPLTPVTLVQFQPIGSNLYNLVIDGEVIGDLALAPESQEWLSNLPTVTEYSSQLDQLRMFFQSQGVSL